MKKLLMAMVIAITLSGVMLAMATQEDNNGNAFGKDKEPGSNLGEPQRCEAGTCENDPHGLTCPYCGYDVYKRAIYPDMGEVCASGFCWACTQCDLLIECTDTDCPDGQKECDGNCIPSDACCTPDDCPIMIGPCVDSMTCDDGVCNPQFKMNGEYCTVNVYDGQCCEGECMTDPDEYCVV